MIAISFLENSALSQCGAGLVAISLRPKRERCIRGVAKFRGDALGRRVGAVVSVQFGVAGRMLVVPAFEPAVPRGVDVLEVNHVANWRAEWMQRDSVNPLVPQI